MARRWMWTALLGSWLLLQTAVAEIVVGSDARPDQELLAAVTTLFLEEQGLPARQTTGFGGAVLRQAQEQGRVDLIWEYTGAALVGYNGIRTRLSPEATYRTVKLMDADKGLVWLEPTTVLAGYRLAMPRDRAEALEIDTLSDLASALNYGATLRLATTPEFSARADGLQPLQRAYGFRFPRARIRQLDAGLIPQLLVDGQADVGVVSLTDPRVASLALRVLDDDRRFFPPYQLAAVVREETLRQFPHMESLLNHLARQIDSRVVGDLSNRVAIQRQSVEAVARDFLQTEGLI